MNRMWLIAILMLFLTINSANALEFKPLELSKNKLLSEQEQEQVKNIESDTPKALLNDDNYKFKGRVEYDENGILFLDDSEINSLNIKISKPKKFIKKSVFEDDKMLTKIEEQHRRQVPVVDEYLALPFFGGSEYKAGKNFTYGTTFSTDLDMAQLEYRTNIFTRYDNKFFGIMTAFGKDAYTSSGRQMDSIYISPELKMNKGVSLVGVFKANPEYDRYRNDVLVQYRPNIKNSRENLALEAGLSQTNYYSTGELFYQFMVSTKFKF